MFNKAEQARRAADLSSTLAAQGHAAPVLPMPPIKKKEPQAQAQAPQAWPFRVLTVTPGAAAPLKAKVVILDCAGQELQIGDRVATTYDGKLAALVTGEIIGFSPKKVNIKLRIKYRDGSFMFREVTKFPEQIARVNPVWVNK